MYEALPQTQPPFPEPWPPWRQDELIGMVHALMVDGGFFRSVSSAKRGKSGVLHQFTMIYFDGDSQTVVDVYDRASAVEVIQTYAKSLDTSSKARIVSADEPTEFAEELAQRYGIALDTAPDIQEMYDGILGEMSPRTEAP